MGFGGFFMHSGTGLVTESLGDNRNGEDFYLAG